MPTLVDQRRVTLRMDTRMRASRILALGAIAALALQATPAVATTETDTEAMTAAAVAQVVAGSPTAEGLATATELELLEQLVRCVDLAGKDYCLHAGFVDDADDPALWADLERRMAAPASATGDMTLSQRLQQVAALSAEDRQRLEVAEVERAAAAAVEASSMSANTAGEASAQGPQSGWLTLSPPVDDTDGVGTYKILSKDSARKQIKDYYCGPATLQMIDGADDGGFESQPSWAADLGTESVGATWIGDMVYQINAKTDWDTVAGSFAIRDISSWDKERYWTHITAQLASGAPYVEHPSLHNNYYPYLSTPGGYGGHFQVGRGFQREADDTRYIHIFEPYNEPDWTSYTTTTWGPRRSTLHKVFNANLANQANIGT